MTNVIARHQSATQIPLMEALALGAGVWDELLNRSPGSGPFMSWAWHRSWAEAVEPETLESARVMVLQSATGRPELLFPFRVYRTRFRRVEVTALGWAIDDLGCPDHLELLASPEADLHALTDALDDVSWDVILLSNVADRAPNIDRFCAACERRGWKARRTPLWRCPYLELPDSWEAYLASLSRHRRQAIRWTERKVRREHQVALSEYDAATLDDGWRHLKRLHHLRWAGPGVFAARGVERLHRWLTSWLADRHQLWLTTLDVDGVPVAAWYGFSFEDTIYYYLGGWDPQWERRSVGTILVGAMIRRAIERGYRRFDFLRGEEPYKTGWTSSARTCSEIVIIRAGWRGVVPRGLDWLARQPMVRWFRTAPGPGPASGKGDR